jgi:hypothetical protein
MQNNEIGKTPLSPPEEAVISDVSHGMPLRILQGAVGGLLGAVVGGIVWGLIFQFTEYEVGYVAWGIGLLCGWAVGYFSLGGRGLIFQLIAIFSSVFGIFLGKYYIYYVILKEYVKEDYGAEYASEITIFSLDTFDFFMESVTELLSFYDIIFVGLAIYTAWRMLGSQKVVRKST